jgi:nonsense-mediated mRNA decay protein 3
MLCLECGKREAKYEGLCEVCFLKKVKFTKLPPHMEIVRCPHCGAVKFKGEWKRLDEDEIIKELIERNFEVLHDYDSINFEFETSQYEGDLNLHVVFHINYKDLKVDEEHYSIDHIKYESCPRCNRFFGNYLEAILQIRGLREGELQGVINYAHERLEHYAQKNEDLFITKEEEKHGGWDIYISDKKEAKKVAEELCRRYGATLKESPHIVGRKDGKDVYRMTYSVRLPDYRVGDVVEIEKSENYAEFIRFSSSEMERIRNIILG